MEKRCLWLINHSTLANWELPLLRSSGYTFVFTPQYIPSNPVFTSGTIDRVNWKSLRISKEDIKSLNTQDWYGRIDEKATVAINANFEMAFVTADPTQVINVLKGFKGQVVIRLFGLDSGRTYSNLYKQSYSPFEWNFLMSNLHRIIFATGYKEILSNEEDWITSNSVYLPIGLPPKQSIEWNGEIERLFGVVPRIEPGSYFSNLLKSHYRMAGRNKIVIGGRQHLLFKDKRILGALQDSEFYSEMLSSRAMIYASKEASHVHYHPLEAMQSGMPVVFYKDSLLGNLLGKDLAGSVKSKGQARRLIRKLMKNILLAKSIGDTQRERVKRIERELLEDDFLQGIKEIERRKSKSLEQVHLRFIICSESHSKNYCASRYNKNLIAIKISNGESEPKTSGMIKFKIVETTQDDVRKKYIDSHRYSKIYSASSDLVYELLAEESADIILCGLTLPTVIVSNSSISRFLNSGIIEELKKQPFSSTLERFRYSLATLDNITVINEDDKKTLLAFAPIQPKIVKVQNI
jgi:hypothetical protein